VCEGEGEGGATTCIRKSFAYVVCEGEGEGGINNASILSNGANTCLRSSIVLHVARSSSLTDVCRVARDGGGRVCVGMMRSKSCSLLVSMGMETSSLTDVSLCRVVDDGSANVVEEAMSTEERLCVSMGDDVGA